MILIAMSETVRLYRYRTLLAGGRVRTRIEMLELLEISPATFKRDLTKLRDQMRMPIVFDREAGGYRMEVDSSMAELPGLWFSQNELLALATTKQMLEQLEPGFWGNRLQPLQERLGELLASHGIDPLELSRRVAVVNTGKRRFESNAFDDTLGGVEPTTLGIDEPLPNPTVSAPIAVDRVAVSACGERWARDVAGPAVIFAPVIAEDTEKAREAVAANLIRRLLSRQPEKAELEGLVTGLYADIAAASTDPKRDWAVGACVVIATSTEALFY